MQIISIVLLKPWVQLCGSEFVRYFDFFTGFSFSSMEELYVFRIKEDTIEQSTQLSVHNSMRSYNVGIAV